MAGLLTRRGTEWGDYGGGTVLVTVDINSCEPCLVADRRAIVAGSVVRYLNTTLTYNLMISISYIKNKTYTHITFQEGKIYKHTFPK